MYGNYYVGHSPLSLTISRLQEIPASILVEKGEMHLETSLYLAPISDSCFRKKICAPLHSMHESRIIFDAETNKLPDIRLGGSSPLLSSSAEL